MKIWPDINSPLLTASKHELRVLIYKIAVKHTVHVHEIKGPSRKEPIANARNEFICKAVDNGFTRQKIGDYLNGRNNSSITWLYHQHKHRYL